MTEEAGKKQAAGCQREEDDNQLDSDLSKVANEIALTNSSLVESNSETDLDDDIVDDAVEIKSLTPPEDLSYLWAPKVTEVCVVPKSPEDASKLDNDKGESESVTKEKDKKNDGQNEGKDRNIP